MHNNNTTAQNSQQYLQSQGFTYFAFISYKHEDYKWAVWLKKKLQDYRLPAKTCAIHRELPSRISPIFLDRDNMKPGELRTNEKDEVQSAKYLIVICSRKACADSRNIDDEIRFFIEGGADPARIIPFIIDSSPRPEVECFPLFLQQICRWTNIIGANVNDSGRDNAVLKVVAYMLGIKLEELVSEDRRRRLKKIVIYASIAAALAVALGVTAFKLLDYYVPKQRYYVDYTEVYGLPKGIGELSKSETQSIAEFYVIKSQYGKVQSLRHVNSYGVGVEETETEHSDRPAQIWYGYTQDGALSEVTYTDTVGNPIDKRVYNGSNMKTLDIKRYSDENSSDYDSNSPLSARTVRFMDTDSDMVGQKSNIVRYLIDYDENGYVTEIRYASNTSNYAATDADGISGIRYVRDELGRIRNESYLTHTGSGKTAENPDDYEVIGTRTGLSTVWYKYDNFDCVEMRYLDADGELTIGVNGAYIDRSEFVNHNDVRDSFYDADGEPMMSSYGCASGEMEYDSRGNLTSALYLGTDGDPILNSQGFSSVKLEYDEDGRLVRQSYFGTDGSPVLYSEGFSSGEMIYDDLGRLSRVDYFGTDGAPVITKYGNSSWEATYDKNGREVYRGFFNTDGEYVLFGGDYAYYTVEYDSHGYISKQSYFGTDLKPVLTSEGIAAYECEYDERGNEIKRSFYGADGKRTKISYGYAGWDAEYDERGNKTRISYFDEKEKPIKNTDGYAGWTAEYDERGNQVNTSYFDEEGKLCESYSGYASWSNEYDERGNLVATVNYNAGGDPVMAEDSGFASMVRQYDERGNITGEALLGEDGELLLTDEGYSIVVYEYDKQGNTISESYYGKDSEPVMYNNEYWLCSMEYDKQGNVTEYRYYDVNKKLTPTNDGFAIKKLEYDERGNEIKASFYDAQENPQEVEDSHYTSRTQEYDERGNKTKISFFDKNGDLVLNKNDFAVREYEYDERNNLIRESFFGTDYEPVCFKGTDIAATVMEYDERSNRTKKSFYGTDGRLKLSEDGCAGWISEYDERSNEIRRSYFGTDGDPAERYGGYASWEKVYDDFGIYLRYTVFYDINGKVVDYAED